MARKKVPFEIREINIATTQRLASTIRETSGFTRKLLEAHFGIGSESPFGGKTGTQWKRYEEGERTIQLAEGRDQMAREAFLLGWLPDEPPSYLEELGAWGSLGTLMARKAAGEVITAEEVAEDRKRWLDWSRTREKTKESERKSLGRFVARVVRDITALDAFLCSIDRKGHDYWAVDLPDRDVVVDYLGNIETVDGASDLLDKLNEVMRLVQTIELKVLHEFAADMIPPNPISHYEEFESTS